MGSFLSPVFGRRKKKPRPPPPGSSNSQVNGGQAAASARIRDVVENLTGNVVGALIRRQPHGGTFHIEDIQDQVELALMRSGEHEVARAYVLYREKRNDGARQAEAQQAADHRLCSAWRRRAPAARPGPPYRRWSFPPPARASKETNPQAILQATLRDIYDGVPMDEVRKSLILSARSLIEKDPDYTYVTSRLLMHSIRREVLGEEVGQHEMNDRYADYFQNYINQGIEAELLDERLRQFDLPRLAAALKAGRDQQFDYLGLQTLYDRYFLHIDERRIELPQAFFMRVAMGLALNEIDREARAIEFYQVLSTFDYMSSTPTLFNAGTRHSATVVLLPDHHPRRPGRHLPGHQGKRTAGRNTPAAWATTGPACARWAPTSRAPTANRRASCRS